MSIIAISRGTFSGGEALATRLAARLGYQCLSRETNLEAAAQRYRVPMEGLIAAMEKRPSLLERLVDECSVYLTFVRATLCEHARKGKLVYHGYLGHLLLPGISHVIRVRVIADTAYRLQAAQRQLNLAPRDALAHIQRVDKERREWTRSLFEVDWDNPHLYDVILNLSRMSLETACETVARLTELAEFQLTSESLKAIQDLTLHSRVSAALAADFRTRDAKLTVTVESGVVTITGTSPWSEVVDAVPAVARQVDGVNVVNCEITGGTPPRSLTWY